MRIALLLAYDGRRYRGWQKQAAEPTVQAALEDALATRFQQPIGVTGSGRTDSGVHAWGQVAHADLPPGEHSLPELQRALRALLPDDIQVRALQAVPDDFHARYQARRREYRYYLLLHEQVFLKPYAWLVPAAIDSQVLVELAAGLRGTMDFTSFCSSRSEVENKVCTVEEARWRSGMWGLEFVIRADRFLHHMVRYLVGCQVAVAAGQMSLEEYRRLFKEPSQSHRLFRAPAQGLFLWQVEYPPELGLFSQEAHATRPFINI